MLTNQNPLFMTFALASQNDAFNQEKALVASRGLLRDCKIFANLHFTLV